MKLLVIIRKMSILLFISILISYLLSKVILNQDIYFIYSLSFLASLFLLIAWYKYLVLDGLFKSKTIEDEEFVHLEMTPKEYEKLKIISLLLSSFILFFITVII